MVSTSNALFCGGTASMSCLLITRDVFEEYMAVERTEGGGRERRVSQ
jgi:hypothetical protein